MHLQVVNHAYGISILKADTFDYCANRIALSRSVISQKRGCKSEKRSSNGSVLHTSNIDATGGILFVKPVHLGVHERREAGRNLPVDSPPAVGSAKHAQLHRYSEQPFVVCVASEVD